MTTITLRCAVEQCPDDVTWAETICKYHSERWGAYLAGFEEGSGCETNLSRRVLPTTSTSWQYRFNKFLEYEKKMIVFRILGVNIKGERALTTRIGEE